MKNKTVYLLFFIALLGIYLRFDRLTVIPPALSHDESAIAYNAYSILKTGKDEYGVSYPLLFRSFDDYKLPGMVYSTVPFVVLFGRSEIAARLPSAIFGALAILVMFGIAYELTKSTLFSLSSTLFLAIQPWHINFSRQLFESNGAVFWFMVGTYFLLRSRRRYSEILLAGLGYVVALYFYYSVRLVIPFVTLLYLFIYWKTIIKNWKTTLLALLICFVTFFPIGKEMLSPGGMERISIVSVTNDPNYMKKRDDMVRVLGINPSLITKIMYNRRVALFQTIIENYGKNISFHNLFVTGTGTYGALYPFEILLVPLGIAYALTLTRFSKLLIFLWLFTAFLPGAFSVNQPNTLRTLIAAPVFAILSGFGAALAIQKWKYAAIFIGIIFIFTFPKFHYAYFVNNPTNNALAFGDGYKQMIAYVKSQESKYDRIYISGYYWRPYVFMLYWGGIDPTVYQHGGNREHFGKYYFTSSSWDTNGIKLMDRAFDFNTLPTSNKTLFILAYPEYQMHQQKFQKIATIDGRHIKNVFIASERIPED